MNPMNSIISIIESNFIILFIQFIFKQPIRARAYHWISIYIYSMVIRKSIKTFQLRFSLNYIINIRILSKLHFVSPFFQDEVVNWTIWKEVLCVLFFYFYNRLLCFFIYLYLFDENWTILFQAFQRFSLLSNFLFRIILGAINIKTKIIW